MGMAASQGRLLFMTARLSNNEFEQQCVAYSKQKLAETSKTANDRYLEALKATQYQVLTGYNGTTPTYEPVTYNQLTGVNSVATGKQYIVSDNLGKIVVSNAIAKAFEASNGDYNKFLERIGGFTQVDKTNVSYNDVHEAWDRYLVSVDFSNPDKAIYIKDENGNDVRDFSRQHILGFGFNSSDKGVEYATYKSAYISVNNKEIYLNKEETEENGLPKTNYYMCNYEVKPQCYQEPDGTTSYKAYYQTEEQERTGDITTLDNIEVVFDTETKKYSYIYSDGVHEKLFVKPDDSGIVEDANTYVTPDEGYEIKDEEQPIHYEGTNKEQRDLYDYAIALSKYYATNNKDGLKYDADQISHYKNIYNQMLEKGYTTYEQMRKEDYIATIDKTENQAYQDEQWLITQLKKGKLNISYFSATEKEFIATTLDDDESITEKDDKKKIAIAEQEYNATMDRIESEDKRFDMQLNRLEAEHSALQTEYDSVAKVISKNVEKSFNIFNA